MENMDSHIVSFMQAQTAATICCIDDHHRPYCFNAFYAFDESKATIYFKSQLMKTHHGPLLSEREHVSGTIVPDELDKVLVKGIQFVGRVQKNDIFDIQSAMHYHTRHPMAMAVPGEMWTIHVDYIKFTDNAMGFGHKLIWQREGFSL